MGLLDKWNPKIQQADIALLTKGYHQLTEMEVDLEARLKDVREAKARFMVEIDLRLNDNGKK